MYDITIRKDGCPDLSTGDLSPADFAIFIGQKIYQAIMNVPMSLITGADQTKPEIILRSLRGYLVNYFSTDGYIVTSGFDVRLRDRGSQRAALSVIYQGTSPTGTAVNYQSTMDFNIDSGRILSIDYEPAWLMERDNPTKELISVLVTVEENTDRIEIPLEPYHGGVSSRAVYPPSSTGLELNDLDLVDTNSTTYTSPVPGDLDYDTSLYADDVIALLELGSTSDLSVTRAAFTIPVTGDRMLYSINRYITGFDSTTQNLLGATITSVTTGIQYRRRNQYGEEVVVVTSGAGDITGLAYYTEARHATYQYEVRDKMSRSYVFPLRPVRGRIYAVFPRSVKPGNYVLKYNAMTNPRS